MTLPAHVTIPDDVMSRQIADEVVLLDLASGNYYGLDAVGARIWQLFTEGKTPAEAEARVLEEYDVSASALRADMERLLGELLAQGLLSAT